VAVIKATPVSLPSGMSNGRRVVSSAISALGGTRRPFHAGRLVSTARHPGDAGFSSIFWCSLVQSVGTELPKVQMTGCFDDSRHMTVPPPSTAMSGNEIRAALKYPRLRCTLTAR
jgi:hypothetical protein